MSLPRGSSRCRRGQLVVIGWCSGVVQIPQPVRPPARPRRSRPGDGSDPRERRLRVSVGSSPAWRASSSSDQGRCESSAVSVARRSRSARSMRSPGLGVGWSCIGGNACHGPGAVTAIAGATSFVVGLLLRTSRPPSSKRCEAGAKTLSVCFVFANRLGATCRQSAVGQIAPTTRLSSIRKHALAHSRPNRQSHVAKRSRLEEAEASCTKFCRAT